MPGLRQLHAGSGGLQRRQPHSEPPKRRMQSSSRGTLGELADPVNPTCIPRKKNPGSSESQGGGGLQLLPGAIGSASASSSAGVRRFCSSHRHGQNSILIAELGQYVFEMFNSVAACLLRFISCLPVWLYDLPAVSAGRHFGKSPEKFPVLQPLIHPPQVKQIPAGMPVNHRNVREASNRWDFGPPFNTIQKRIGLILLPRSLPTGLSTCSKCQSPPRSALVLP